VRLADGTAVERAYIEHPGAVVLVPLLGENVLMLRQYRPSLQQTILELPAGTRGWDEPWPDCAQRELREETGYQASDLIDLGVVWAAPGVSDEQMALYLATGLTPAPLPADPDEELVVVAMPLEELAVMALDGRLQDAKSIIAILRAAVYLYPEVRRTFGLRRT
jgi:ADP-ribose pyrophosphatase